MSVLVKRHQWQVYGLTSLLSNPFSPLSCHTKHWHQPCADHSYTMQDVSTKRLNPILPDRKQRSGIQKLINWCHTIIQGKLKMKPYEKADLLEECTHSQPALCAPFPDHCQRLQQGHTHEALWGKILSFVFFYFLNFVWSKNTESLSACF